ncbi:flavin reductase family protein [Azorhizobium doebereinerae]|uniref:flavin reductase family protein n=1 Tax=Azorhizobium doebereinerae TaxID=281091 RepID=UPI00040463DB|nr:flavin reductase family protein [Azorhizobium doebereinerae]
MNLQAEPPNHALTDAYRAGMRRLAGAVSVLTVGEGTSRTGLTASSLTSFSVDPPTLLICINKGSSVRGELLARGVFAVNVLAAGQQELAERFAGMKGLHGEERFAAGGWTQLATGAPVLDGALANFDCRLDEVIERHSHMIVLGRVVATRLAEAAEPLLYWSRGFRQLDL